MPYLYANIELTFMENNLTLLKMSDLKMGNEVILLQHFKYTAEK